jgi:hypothetical protein
MSDAFFVDIFSVILKYGLLVFLFMYILFAAVVIKQVNVMTQTVKMGFESFVKIIAIAHFALAIFVFIFSLSLL